MRPALGCDAANGADRGRWQCAGNQRHAWFDDAGLLKGNRIECLAKVLLMIETYRRDDPDGWRQNIRRVKSAPEADLDDGDLHVCSPEQLEPKRGRGLEKGWMNGEDAFRLQLFGTI